MRNFRERPRILQIKNLEILEEKLETKKEKPKGNHQRELIIH